MITSTQDQNASAVVVSVDKSSSSSSSTTIESKELKKEEIEIEEEEEFEDLEIVGRNQKGNDGDDDNDDDDDDDDDELHENFRKKQSTTTKSTTTNQKKNQKSKGILLPFILLLWRNSKYRTLWFANFISLLGDWFSFIACVQILNRFLPSSLTLSLFLICRLLPQVCFASLAGVFADSLDKKWMMLSADLARIFIVSLLVFTNSARFVYLIFILNFAQFALGAHFDIAKSALIPALVDSDHELIIANGIDGTTWSFACALGSALGGVATSALGVTTCFLIDAATFLVSAACVATLIWRFPRVGKPGEKTESKKLEEISKEFEMEDSLAIHALNRSRNISNNNNNNGKAKNNNKKKKTKTSNLWKNLNDDDDFENIFSESDDDDNLFDNEPLEIQNAEGEGKEEEGQGEGSSSSANNGKQQSVDIEEINANKKTTNKVSKAVAAAATRAAEASNSEMHATGGFFVESDEYISRIYKSDGKTIGLGMFKNGILYILRRKSDLFVLCFYKGCLSFVWSGVDLINVRFTKEVFNLGRDDDGALSLGILFSVIGIGTLVGPILVRYLAKERISWFRAMLVLGLAIQAAGIYVQAWSPNYYVLLLGTGFLRPAGEATGFVFSSTTMQLLIHERFRGRVFALESTIRMLAESIGAISMGLALDRFQWTPFRASVVSAVIATLFTLFWLGYAVAFVVRDWFDECRRRKRARASNKKVKFQSLPVVGDESLQVQ